MSVRELTTAAMDDGFLDRGRLGGRTPHKTMQSKISVHIRKYGANSVFVNTAPGRYFLRSLLSSDDEAYEVPPYLPRVRVRNELVYAFPQDLLDSVGRFQGIRVDWAPYWHAINREGACDAVDRMRAENDDRLKQVLTYILVRNQAGELLCFDRGLVNRVDVELQGRSCIGFGGHVSANPSLFDSDCLGLYQSAATELSEELVLPEGELRALRSDPESHLRMIGVLNDDSSANGRRHFAVLMEYVCGASVEWDRPLGREKSINKVRWLTEPAAERVQVHQLEYWSQLCLRQFAPSLANAAPSFRVRRSRRLRAAKALVITGQVASGKTEASRLLQDEFGFEQVNSGQVVAELLGLPPIPETPRATFQTVASRFISQPEGPRKLALALAGKVAAAPGRVLVDGVRQPETIAELSRELGRGKVAVIYVHTPFNIALELYRGREDESISAFGFAERRSAPVELDVLGLMDDADAAIYNWLGYDKYVALVREFASAHLGQSL